MAITLNAARQDINFAYVDIALADLTSAATAAAIKLPVGSIVLSGSVVVTTAFNSVTSDVIIVGDDTTGNRYLGSTSIAATGRTALVPTGFLTTYTEPTITVKWTGAGTAPSTGALRLEVAYVTKHVADYTQG